MIRASRRGLLRSAHDLADGGLAQALVESCLRRGFGVSVELSAGVDPFVMLFSESTGRVLVSITPSGDDDLVGLCEGSGVRLARLGVVGAGGEDAELQIDGQFSLRLTEVRHAWSSTLPTAMAAH